MFDHPDFFLVLSAALFAIGTLGVTMRRNPLVMFMSIELMLNAANLALVAFTKFPVVAGAGEGPGMVFVVITVAAAEAVVGLAIIITIFRRRRDVDVDDLTSLRG